MRLPIFDWLADPRATLRSLFTPIILTTEADDARREFDAEWEVAEWLHEQGWPLGAEMQQDLSWRAFRAQQEELADPPPIPAPEEQSTSPA